MIIYLIRHGETTINKQLRFLGQFDIGLSSHGIQQAKEAAAYLEDIAGIDVYSSDLRRAVQTAQIIVDSRKTKVVERRGLREIDFGEWEGLTYDEIRSVDGDTFDAWMNDYRSVDIPGGETWAEFSSRIVDAFLEIIDCNYFVNNDSLKEHSEIEGERADNHETGKTAAKTILIVTHGGPIRLITSCLVDDSKHFENFWPTAGSVHRIALQRLESNTDAITGDNQAINEPCRKLRRSYRLIDCCLNLQIS